MSLVETIPIKVLFDRKEASQWKSENPVVDEGELVVELDTHKLKVGDGKTAYNDLPYYEGPQGESVTKVQLSEDGELSVWIGDRETKLGNVKGSKGDTGTGITDIRKEGETLTITLSDESRKTFTIPNGKQGPRGKSVESARVDESGHLKLKIEEETELDLGSVKGDKGPKGDSITITSHKRVSDGTQVSFSDGTQIIVPKGEKGDVNGINLEDYVTKSELKNVAPKGVHIGETPPEDTEKLWIDTSVVTEGDLKGADLSQLMKNINVAEKIKKLFETKIYAVDFTNQTQITANDNSKLDYRRMYVSGNIAVIHLDFQTTSGDWRAIATIPEGAPTPKGVVEVQVGNGNVWMEPNSRDIHASRITTPRNIVNLIYFVDLEEEG
ncbi:hyaluronate lyase N-terminal domain-containing protein [Streptococcus phocae subsp. salmonis]|uniref:hyaluronate lyase N-terminal domain-containing protein n=1 Tax=Streptococcus phocae TaxID=119224 RepID=UPI000B20FBBD|nr:hyaluronoglucosaminidase [Streptococcus phocae]QBX27861.1 hyaluronoglucosaminidase [Streptococcus phage Javan420]